MSEVMLTVRDVNRALHRTIHGCYIETLVAALAADPETIEELQTALGRFLHREEQEKFFASWRPGDCDQPWDAGVCIIDLAARLIVCESTYSSPGSQGAVEIRDIPKIGSTCVPYHLADDWQFVRQVECWEWHAEKRRRERQAAPPLDARPILYDGVCEFIAREVAARAAESDAAALDDDTLRATISGMHAGWLIAPRDDLRGQSPRDLLVARHDHISWDTQDRSEQWGELRVCPPGLSIESAAYRFAGFGTHEIVLYYELVRALFWNCWEHAATKPHHLVSSNAEPATPLSTPASIPDVEAPTPLSTASGERGGGEGDLAAEIRRLQSLRDEWLDTPDVHELHGRTPRSVIERERQRLPEGTTGKEAMVDPDCPCCQWMADDDGVYFWHMDGCNMDDDFAFAFHERTREEWDKKQEEYARWDREFKEREASREAGGQRDSVWQTSYVDPDWATGSPMQTLFGLSFHLAELTQNLKDATADQQVIDDLNRTFGNLRAAAEEPSAALVEPVIDRLTELLATIGDAQPQLVDKCDDLEQRLTTFARRLVSGPEDEDIPF